MNRDLPGSMNSYTRYVERTEELLTRILEGDIQHWKVPCLPLLDGEPWAELRKTVDLKQLRAQGAFFTSQRLARLAIDPRYLPRLYKRGITAIDPACGAGDLLLSLARHLDVKPTLSETLECWGRHLMGFDQLQQFVRLTKLRLTLLALYRGAAPSHKNLIDLNTVFPSIRCTDGLMPSQELGRADLIILNPPYHLTSAPRDCTWARGRITAAAYFFQRSLLNAKAGARIIAILPDVLRTGTRYSKWRQFIEQHSTVDSIRTLGLFDKTADVHVFILVVTTGRSGQGSIGQWWKAKGNKSKHALGDFFDVHVGAVVPHRHRKTGKPYPYIHARSVAAWSRINKISEVRRFKGTTFSTPFVVIRRTSRPEDTFRAVATLVSQPGTIAVENHLIVCRPKDGTIKSCTKLIRLLKSKHTNTFLNERIRCRHLSVSAIRELPFLERPHKR